MFRGLVWLRRSLSQLFYSIRVFVGSNFNTLRVQKTNTKSFSMPITHWLKPGTQRCHSILPYPPITTNNRTTSTSILTGRFMSSGNPQKKKEVLQSHYTSHSADSYESAFFYEAGAYTKHVQRLVQDRLRLHDIQQIGDHTKDLSDPPKRRRPRRLLDIGGGTGNFTRMLLEGTNNLVEAIVVDPFLEHAMTDEEGLKFVQEPAEDFLLQDKVTWWKQDYDQVLLKEVVHHFAEQDRMGIFRGMYQGLTPTTSKLSYPSILIITRPQIEIDYPLWEEARQVWAKNQVSLEELTKELKHAGFTNISHSLEPYACAIALSRWQSMVRNRFWSTFSNFSDEELRDACQRMAKDYQDRIDSEGIIHFEDRLLFITACKQAL